MHTWFGACETINFIIMALLELYFNNVGSLIIDSIELSIA